MPSTLGEVELKLPPDGSPRLASLGAWRQSLDHAAQAYANEAQQAVHDLLGAAGQFEEGWQSLCREALAGRITEMHALRDRFLGAFADRLRLLGEALDFLRFAERVAQHDLPETAQLEEEMETLASKLKGLSSRWQTAEDLEDLAAESIAPSTEKLEAVRHKYGYPQGWYDSDSKPF